MGLSLGLGLEPAALIPPPRAVCAPATVTVVGVHVDGDHVGAAAEADCRDIVEADAEGPGGGWEGPGGGGTAGGAPRREWAGVG